MADFRRSILALAVLAVIFAAVPSASAQTLTPFTCTASAAVPPLLRSEGLTELTGDIVLTCTGNAPAANQTANVTVFLNTTVTSRLITPATTGAATVSEALLLVNEPNANAAVVCASGTGCPGGGANAFAGIVTGNSVTFIGIPVTPPGSTGNTIYRITNVRANTSAVSAGTSFGGAIPGQVQALVSISGSSSIPLNNPQQVVGFVQPGLAASVLTPGLDTVGDSDITFKQCLDINKSTQAAVLRFKENFATAFKTGGDTTQTVPGSIYNTESGYVTVGFSGTGNTTTGLVATAGLADFGTRLKATFTNLPAGVTLYVSTTNVIGGANAPALPSSPHAKLVGSETGPGTFTIPTTDTFNGITVAQIPVVTGTATVVWEVDGANPLASENYDFMIHYAASANPAGNSPAAGTGSVGLSFAPTYAPSVGGVASAGLPIPRFVDTSTATNAIIVQICQTSLLFPFVTNQAGFDTGLAIANTSTDPFGTGAQAGTCTWNFYGDNAPAAITTSDSIATGTVATSLASSVAPNFQGYVIAVCQFQYAHGFAFISDVGARNLAMGYLALVVDDRGQTGESLGQ